MEGHSDRTSGDCPIDTRRYLVLSALSVAPEAGRLCFGDPADDTTANGNLLPQRVRCTPPVDTFTDPATGLAPED